MFISTTVASERLGICPRHVRWLLKQGRLRGQKFGRDWQIVEASLRGYHRHHNGGRFKSKAG